MIGLDSIASERLCLTLLHSLWQVALLALAAWGIDRCLGRRRENASYVVHATALVVGLIAAPITHAFLSYGGSTPVAESVPPPVAVASVSADLATGVSQLPSGFADAAELEAPSPFAAPIAPAAPVIDAVPGFTWQSIMLWLAGAYLFGVVLMLARLARSAFLLERLRASAQPVVDGPLFNALASICSQWSLKTAPALAHAEQVVVPKVVGLLKPTILLPSSALTGLPIDDLELILAHELAHVRRHDLWINLLQRLAESILFFNPAMWWLSRRVSTLREYCCDDRACAVIPEDAKPQLRYAEALLHAVELQHTGSSEQVAALAAAGRSPSELRRRVARLFGEQIGESIRLSRSGVAVLLAGVALLLVAPTIADSSGADESGPEASSDRTIGFGQTQPETDANEPGSAGLFQGQVNGPDGKPFEGAKLYMVPIRGWNATKELGSVRATTDEQGRFEFEAADMTYTAADGLPSRHTGLIIVTADGHGPDWMYTWGADYRTSFGRGAPRKGAPIDLQLGGSDVPIRGRLLGSDGKPLVDALVKLSRAMVPSKRDLSSHLVDEEKQVYFMSGPHYARSTYQPELIPGLDASTRTDINGRFVLQGLGRDRLARLIVSHPKIVDTHLDVMTREGEDFDASTELLGGGGVSERTIYASDFTEQLSPGVTIRGRVIDEKSGKPITGMHVGRGLNQNSPLDPKLYPHVTDEEGRFLITGLHSTGSRTHKIVAVAGPGLPYRTAWVELDGEQNHHDVVIRCHRGIPYRLTVVDDRGEPVDARVDYVDVAPNPHTTAIEREEHYPVSKATRVGPGVYEGFVLPGPGVIRVQGTHQRYRPAMVDPQSYFGDGRGEIDPDKYGTAEIIKTVNRRHISGDHWYREHRFSQDDYDALVLVNPAPDSEAFELTARLISDVPRDVSLVDPDGKPVVGATMMRGTGYGWGYRQSTLRSSSFTLSRLHPDRVERVGFLLEDRELIGYLPAKNDANDLYTVRMQQWATVTGRLVDEEDKPLANQRVAAHSDAIVHYSGDKCDQDGRFTIKKLVPGYPVRGTIWLRHDLPTQTVFEDIILQPGGARDLGDLRVRSWAAIDQEANGSPNGERSQLKVDDKQASPEPEQASVPVVSVPREKATAPDPNSADAKTFDDIKFDIEPDASYNRSMLTAAIESLIGQRIRIRGYILPTADKRGQSKFVLVRDNLECCFGPGAALYDCIVVEMSDRKTVDFSSDSVVVEGIFTVDELKGPNGRPLAVFRMRAEKVEP